MRLHHCARWLGLALCLSAGSSQAAPVLAPAWAVQTEGRALASRQGWQATWPGVNWTLRFQGPALGVKLQDAANYYALQLDGVTVREIAPAPGEREIWVRGLSAGPHSVRLFKKTEWIDTPGRFGGFLLEQGKALPPAARPQRQIEFIGDSHTVAYGNLSPTRNCSPAEIMPNSDASQSFAALSGRHFGAEIQLNGMSGMGVVRNWDGNLPDVNYRSYYPRVLHNLPQTAPGNDAYANSRWQPQLVVISLGINDFSTPVKAGEPRSQEQLQQDFLTGYRQLLAQLKQRYQQPAFVLSAMNLWPDDRQRPLVSQLVDEERARGSSIAYVDWQGLELTGCNWHPSLADHQKMSQQLNAAIQSLGSIWY